MNQALHVADLVSDAERPAVPGEPLLRADRRLGELLVASGCLAHGDVGQVRQHQRETKLRFGDAAVALGLVARDDVVSAIAQQFEYPYLGRTPHRLSPALVTALEPFSASAAAFRDLRSRLLLATRGDEQPARPIVVASPQSGDGRSYCAANIAISFSQLGCKTLLLEADLRAPQQRLLFGLPEREGLSSMLAGRSLVEAVVPVRELANLHLLPAGTVPPNPQELLSRPALGHLLQALRQMFDQIIVDVPAAAAGADARMVAAVCGATVLVGRRDRSAIPHLDDLARQLRQDGGHCLGVLVNAPP